MERAVADEWDEESSVRTSSGGNRRSAASGTHRAAGGRKRTRSDAVRRALDPTDLEPPDFVEASDFVGLGQAAVERLQRFIAILRGDPVVPKEKRPSGRLR